MYPWGKALGEAGRVLGMGLGQPGQSVDYQQQEFYQRAYGADMDYRAHANYVATFTSTSANNTLYIDDTEAEEVKLRVEDPPDEFTQLSNHKFHELLDRFKETT